MRESIVTITLLACLIISVAQAEEPLFRASRLNHPGNSAEPGAISAHGTVAGVAYFYEAPHRRVFWQRGQVSQFVPLDQLPESSNCMPRAVSNSGAVVSVAGTCGGGVDPVTAWFWNGQSVRALGEPSPFLFITGMSSAGIVAGNVFPPGVPVNPATLWNGTDGTSLPIYGSVFGAYTAGISSNGLVGLSPRPATYSISTDQSTLLPFPPGNWNFEGSNQFTMTHEGTFAGEIVSMEAPSVRKLVLWRNNSIVRQLDTPAVCRYPNHIEFVARTIQDRVIVGCRNGLSMDVTPYISLSNGQFVTLASRTSGSPTVGALQVLRHSSSSGVLVGTYNGDPSIWLLTPVQPKITTRKLVDSMQLPCVGDDC